MPRAKAEWTQDTVRRFIKEGRGEGDGKDYKPWFTIHDFPSKGRASRVLGWKTKRIHHFFSDLQLRYFYLLEWEQSVTDIKEHFPLLDLDTADFNKGDLRIDKFRDKNSNESYVLCTTFLITKVDGNGDSKVVARSVKNASDLNKAITLDKLEIERRYWKSKGIDWGIITNKDINTIRAKNIEWIHSMMNYEEENENNITELQDLTDAFLYRISESDETIRKTILSFEQDYNFDSGKGILFFKYLIAKRKIIIDMDKPINLNDKRTTLSINNKTLGSVKDL